MCSDYYKSLIPDDEVIKELLKETQRREGKLINPRIRPNVNFLQRTVTNLVSSNSRLERNLSSFKTNSRKISNKKIKEKSQCNTRNTIRKKPDIDYKSRKKQFLQQQIKFVKASDDKGNDNLKENNDKINSSSSVQEIIILSSDEDNC